MNGSQEQPQPSSRDEPPAWSHLTRRWVLLLCAGFTGALTLAAWLVAAWVQKRRFGSVLAEGQDFGTQAAWGLGTGVGAALVITWVVLRAPFLGRLRRVIRDVLEAVRPRTVDLLLVSLGAGWGEELFFRGVLQESIGLWWSAAAFALVHGFWLRSARSGFGLTLYVFAAGVGLGFLYEHVGLAAAMIAHAAYDFVNLIGYVSAWRRAGGGRSARLE